MTMQKAVVIPPLIDDPDAPVIFVDEVVGGGGGDILNLTFAVFQHDHSSTPPRAYRKTCLRIIIPRQALLAASDFVSTLIQRGPAPTPVSGKPTIQ